MSYIEDSLSSGEEVYEIFEHHWTVSLTIILHFFLGVATLGIWLLPAVYIWLKWRCTENGVTNKRVIHKYGIISRKTDEMKLGAIESIVIKQGILGRIFGFGDVIISGRGVGNIVLHWIKDPMEAKRDVESAEHEKE